MTAPEQEPQELEVVPEAVRGAQPFVAVLHRARAGQEAVPDAVLHGGSAGHPSMVGSLSDQHLEGHLIVEVMCGGAPASAAGG